MTHAQPGRPTVLVVEDDADLRATIVDSLEAGGFAATYTAEASDAIDRLQERAYDGLVLELRLPNGDGLAVLREALSRYPQLRAVAMTGFAGVAEAVDAVRLGAVDFLIKPFQLSQLARVLRTAMEQLRLREENAALKAQLQARFRFENVIGRHDSLRQLLATLELAAPMNSAVLIHGEPGTGKELIARTIHHNSPRRDRRFVVFNAAALPEALADAELFGQAPGPYRDGSANRTGRLELAHRGTLFIDGVASMSLPLQAKLLRALQEREIERAGDPTPMAVDVRVIAGTSTDLKPMVRDRSFREDLFYRLSVIPVQLPPLRDRREDIPLLAQHFLTRACRENGLAAKAIAHDTMEMLMRFDWPGNVRQLESVIEYAVTMSAGVTEIQPEALPLDVRAGVQGRFVNPIAIPDEGIPFTSVVSQLERDLILRCLEKTNGNKRQAARLLNLSRTTFIDKLQRLNLEQRSA